jgi:hypothetical protein
MPNTQEHKTFDWKLVKRLSPYLRHHLLLLGLALLLLFGIDLTDVLHPI